MPGTSWHSNRFERDKVKVWDGDLLHKLVCVMREETGRYMIVLFVYTLLFNAAIDAKKEQASRAQEVANAL